MHEADSRTTARGLEYYQQNRILDYNRKGNLYSATVSGNEIYNIEINPESEIAQCNCPAHFPCKHIIAVVFFISAEQQKRIINSQENDSFRDKKFFEDKIYNAPDDQRRTTEKKLSEEFIFQAIDDYRFTARKFNPETKNISSILVSDKLTFADGSQMDYYYAISVLLQRQGIYFNEILNNRNFGNIRFFSNDGIQMKYEGTLDIQQRILKNENLEDDATNYGQSYRIENFYFDPETKKEISCNIPNDIPYSYGNYLNKIHVVKKMATNTSSESVDSKLEKEYKFYITVADESTSIIYRLVQGGRRLLTDIEIAEWKDVLVSAKVQNIDTIVPATFEFGPIFALSIYPDEKGNFKVKCRPEFIYSIDEKYFDEKLLAKTMSGKSSAKFLSRYPARPLNSHQQYKFVKDFAGNIAKRNIKKEKEVFKKFELSTIPFHKKEYVLQPGHISNFIEQEVPVLQKAGARIYIHKDLIRLSQNKKENRTIFKMNSKSSDINWFDGHISIEGMGVRELRMALKAYKKKEDYFRLKDGSWVSLDSIGIKKLVQSFDQLGIRVSSDGEIRKLSRGQMLSIEYEMDTRTDRAIENLLQKIKHLPEVRKANPVNFKSHIQGSLRDYQKQGVLFLESLTEIGIGGILADDMGLGKTIQGLAFIDRLTMKKEDLLTLIVGPLASISVWKKEAQKYFPNLKVTLWHGTERKKVQFPKQGIVLTTYGTLSRDFADWKERHHFDLAILDEAQNLKNFRSLSSHAVRQTNTKLYFCLTGTPLENNVTDLWSLFDICFPGYLGNQKSFQKIYSDPYTELHQNLRKKIEPFVMRRTKEEVLKELPPLTEALVPVTMTEKQKLFYEEARKSALLELANAGQNYLMVMLPHLMKLRRIACHPEAGNPEKTDPLLSGKFQHLQDILDEMKTSASGILIFSQFTDILKICGRLLQNMGHDYHYLDGSTSLAKREKMVNEFQAGEKSFFLISLKAGGTALTLHRADTVIHLDPWWNPAVERQASDRAHRIGQKQKVFVYKLYSENSIEEKVLELQTIKKELFEALFSESLKKSELITRDQLMKLLEI